MRMLITDFFNAKSIEHLKAYESLCNTGAWPVGFIPDNVEFQGGWQILVMSKLADEYMLAAKLGVIPGMPEFD